MTDLGKILSELRGKIGTSSEPTLVEIVKMLDAFDQELKSERHQLSVDHNSNGSMFAAFQIPILDRVLGKAES